MSIFVNNIKIIGLKNTRVIARVKIKLMVMFEIMNIEPISLYLGFKIDKNCEKKTIKLFQLIYI